MLYIFTSIYDKSVKKCKRIVSINEEHVKIVFIEDYLLNPYEIIKNDIVYFLSLSIKISEIISLLNGKCYIINQKYYEKKYDKLLVQSKLKELGISVPIIIDVNEIDERSFPLMFKSKKQQDFVIRVDNVEELNDAIYEYKSNFYLETKIEHEKEMKAYYVQNELFFYDNEEININVNELTSICNLMKKELDLEVFSLDFLISNNEIFIIDVNPAAGLYNSRLAREKFVRSLK